MGRPPIDECGTRAKYQKGCRCQACRLAEKTYAQAYKAGKAAPAKLTVLTSTSQSPASNDSPGAAEAAVVAELAALPAADPAVCEIAKRLGRDLDNDMFIASHPSISRELRSVLEQLRSNVRSYGKLTAVQSMSSRRSPSA
jgi:hypothetical protein